MTRSAKSVNADLAGSDTGKARSLRHPPRVRQAPRISPLWPIRPHTPPSPEKPAMPNTSDVRIRSVRPLITPAILEDELPLSDTGATFV